MVQDRRPDQKARQLVAKSPSPINYLASILRILPDGPVTAQYVVASEVRHYVVGGGIGQKDKLAYEHPATFPEQLAEDRIRTWRPPQAPLLGRARLLSVCLEARNIPRLARNWLMRVAVYSLPLKKWQTSRGLVMRTIRSLTPKRLRGDWRWRWKLLEQ